MQIRYSTRAIGFLIATWVLPILSFGQPRYELSLIPVPEPDSPALTNGVVWADPDRAVGYLSDRNGPFGRSRCWFSQDGQFTFLPTPEGFSCYTYRANSKGDIVMALMPFVENSNGPVMGRPATEVYLYRAGSLIPVSPYIWGSVSLNERGDVAGLSTQRSQTSGVADSWTYFDGVLRPLLGVEIHDVNEDRDMLTAVPFPEHPYPDQTPNVSPPQQPAIRTHDGRTTALGSLGGWIALGNDMNNKGEVVGASYVEDDLTNHMRAFYYDGVAMKRINLARDDGGSSANSINDSGEIVGTYSPGLRIYAFGFPPVPQPDRGFYAFQGEAHDLESLVVNVPEGLQSPIRAVRIDNEGRILAYSSVSTGVENQVKSVYFLLTPLTNDKTGLDASQRDARRR